MIDVRIVTPTGLYKQTKASIINCHSSDGQRGILENHVPIVMSLDISRLELEEEKREIYAIAGGMLYFHNKNQCTILTSAIEHKNDIDINRAMEAKKRAEDHIGNSNSDTKRAELALKRAINRINVVK